MSNPVRIQHVKELRTPEAVRERCSELLQIGINGDLPWFELNLAKLDIVSELVITEMQHKYPNLEVPFHSRWRHFELAGRDLWKERANRSELEGLDRMVAAGDLAIVSVLLDAGAGPNWRYRDAESGLSFARSEGLAIASLRLFEAGFFSADPENPLRVDAGALQAITEISLSNAMQVSEKNVLVGLKERANLLQRLGDVISSRQKTFEYRGNLRPGHLLLALTDKGPLPARNILVAILENLSDIWPSPNLLDGVKLGDVWKHSRLRRQNATDNLVPFHKLSQWLAYSLIEPIEDGGTVVCEIDGLTGLGEYRNGGLFIDTGVIIPKDPTLFIKKFKPEAEEIVEWRALTVALLDRVAHKVRTSIGLSIEQLPLASVLEGGTWSAGRQIAAKLRSDGAPPIQLDSDATVF